MVLWCLVETARSMETLAAEWMCVLFSKKDGVTNQPGDLSNHTDERWGFESAKLQIFHQQKVFFLIYVSRNGDPSQQRSGSYSKKTYRI